MEPAVELGTERAKFHLDIRLQAVKKYASRLLHRFLHVASSCGIYVFLQNLCREVRAVDEVFCFERGRHGLPQEEKLVARLDSIDAGHQVDELDPARSIRRVLLLKLHREYQRVACRSLDQARELLLLLGVLGGGKGQTLQYLHKDRKRLVELAALDLLEPLALLCMPVVVTKSCKIDGLIIGKNL